MRLLYIVFVYFIVDVAEAESQTFEGYRLLSVFAKTREEARFLQRLEFDYSQIDFWTAPAGQEPGTLLLPPHLFDPVGSAMTKAGVFWKDLKVNVTEIIRDGMRKTPVPSGGRIERSTGQQDIVDHTNYHPYDQIVTYIRELGRKYPNNVDVSYLATQTDEGRNVAMVKLQSSTTSNADSSIVIESGIHAREWISPAATLYAIEKLLQRSAADERRAKSMLDDYNWYIVPMTNPDGYDYSHTGGMSQRLWRKNRRQVSWTCKGVDLNRNFDVQFRTSMSSFNPCSNIYHGPKPFSEAESANIRDLFNSVNASAWAYVSVHSYSQVLLLPWSYANKDGLHPYNYQEQYRVASEMSSAMKNISGNVYRVGAAWDLIGYGPSGTSCDWANTINPNIYSLAYELRPIRGDPRGFNLPPEEIIPTGQELLASLEILAVEKKKPPTPKTRNGVGISRLEGILAFLLLCFCFFFIF